MHTLDYKSSALRASAVLTNSYVAATSTDEIHGLNQIVVLATFTKGNLTTAELKVEFSSDNTNFFQETFQAVAAGTATETLGEHQISATGSYRIAIPVKDRFVRVSVKGTGDVTNSLMSVSLVIGIV